MDAVAASIPFDQLNDQIEYYLAMVDNQIKQKIENIDQVDSSSEGRDPRTTTIELKIHRLRTSGRKCSEFEARARLYSFRRSLLRKR